MQAVMASPSLVPARSWPTTVAWAFLTVFAGALTVVGLGAFAVGLLSGYFLTPWAGRVDHPLHDVLRPGGLVGLSLGIVGTALMTAMLSYTVRKWLMNVKFLGAPVWWLRFHILCGIAGPAYILLHAGLLPPTGLVAVGFWCMLLVAGSGVFGRYVYGHFPATAAGRALDATSARRELADLRAQLVARTADADGERIGRAVALVHDFSPKVDTILGWVWLDFEVRRRSRQIRTLLAGAGLSSSAASEARNALTQQLRLQRNVAAWEVSRRLLRYWHLFHDPLAKAMYLIVAIHVVQALVFGGALFELVRWIPL